MYLSKNSRYVIQKNWFSSDFVRYCFSQTYRNYSSKIPKEDAARPPLRLNVPKDPPVDPQQHLYLLKGCIQCEKMLKKSIEKPQISEKTSHEHLNEINLLLNPNILQNENTDKEVVRKAKSTESVTKSRDSSQNSSFLSKIPKKTQSHDKIMKKIYESNTPILKNKLSVDKKLTTEVKNIQAKPVNTKKEIKKSKSDVFLELRKNKSDTKMEKRKVKSAENITKERLSYDLAPDKKKVKMEEKLVHRTKAQENIDNKSSVGLIDVVDRKETKPIVKLSQLDNKNMSLPVKDDYLTAAIDKAIPLTKTVEVKMKFRVRIDRIGNAEKEQVNDDTERAELAYEVISDSTKPKTPKTIKTEKVVKDVMKTIVDKARDVFEDKRLNKNFKNEQNVQLVKIHDIASNTNFYNKVTGHLSGEGSKYFKQLPFEVTEFEDKSKILNLRRLPYPKTRLEKAVSYQGHINEGSKIHRQYLLNDRFHLSTDSSNDDSILNVRRTPTSSQRILKPLGSQITMIDDVPEYLKYPEFKYVGLSSTANRNFHKTTVKNELKKDFPHKRPVIAMNNIIKSGNLGSPKSSKTTLVNRTVNSLQKEIKKPIHMGIPANVRKVDNESKDSRRETGAKNSRINLPPPQKITRKYPNRFNKKFNFAEEKMSPASEKLKSTPSNKDKKNSSGKLFKNPETVIESNVNVNTSSGLIDKESKMEKEALNSRFISEKKSNYEPCCEEDITNYVNRDHKRKKPVKKETCELKEGAYHYRDITHYKKEDEAKSMTKNGPSLAIETKNTNGVEFQPFCVNESLIQKNKYEPCCEEDITKYGVREDKPKKPTKKDTCELGEGSYHYRDITHYKKEDIRKNERSSLDLKKKKTSEIALELNSVCINESATKKQPEKIHKASCLPKRRQRQKPTMQRTKQKMINVSKPPSTPKMSDNFVNIANESLSKGDKNLSVDSLRMMEKVKKMLDFDLKNAEKIFTVQKNPAPSVVHLVKEPWKWAVNEEELKKWESEKISLNTSEVSVVCLTKENNWKIIEFPEKNKNKKIGNEIGYVLCSDSKTNSSGTEEKSGEKINKTVKKVENFKEKEYSSVKNNNTESPDEKNLTLKSVIVINTDSNHCKIIDSELTECQKHNKTELDPVVYDSSALKSQEKSKGVSVISFDGNKEFDVDMAALRSAKGKDSPINFQKVETKKGSSAIIYDEKNKSWNVDLAQNKQQLGEPLELQKQDQKKVSSKQEKSLDELEINIAAQNTDKPDKMSNDSQSVPPQTSESLDIRNQVVHEEKKENAIDESFPENTLTDMSKKEHYVSDNILEMTKNNSPEKLPAVKLNVGETVKVDISSDAHCPSKITEINLNKDAQKNKFIKSNHTADKDKKSWSKPFYKNFEKYQTPYGEPDFEDKPMKINSDIKSNPNIKKLDSSNKTLVLQDVSKPNDALDNWLKDETDRMANLLIKVLQEASEAKSKRNLLKGKLNEKYLQNAHQRTKKKEAVNHRVEEQKTCKIPVRKDINKSKLGKLNEIPVQSAKNVRPPKTVDAVDVDNMSAFNEDLKGTYLKVNQEVFEVPKEVIDPIGINVDNLPDLKLKKVALPDRLMKMKANEVKKLLKIPKIPLKSVVNAPSKESSNVDKVVGIDLPGPEGLKKWSLVWKYLPAVGCQATVWIFQLAQAGASIFSMQNSSRAHNRIFDNLFAKYGPIVKLPGPLGGEVLLINRPEHIKAVFDQEGKYAAHSILDSVDRCRFLSQTKSTSLLSFEDWNGSEWEEVKKSLTDPTIKVEKYFEYFQDAGKRLVQRISSNRNNRNLVSEDFMDDIKRYCLECFCYVVFDKSLGFLNFDTLDWSDESNRLMKHLSDATDCILKCEIGFQMWRFVDTPSSVVLNNACQSLESFIGKHVRIAEVNLTKKKADIAAGKIQATDLSFIEHMLLINGMNYDEVVCTILDMLLIGVNATSSALGFLLYRLAQNTRVQKMLLKEIRNVLPNKSSELNYHRLHSLKYLQGCLKESLRLNAPMPLLIRNLQHEVSLPEYQVSKDTFIVMDTQAQCMREHNFEDADKYLPERWLDPGHMNLPTIPFCHGPKAEIGKLLSEIQIWSSVAQILRNFKIEYNYGDIKGTNEVISFPDKPLKLNFIDREE